MEREIAIKLLPSTDRDGALGQALGACRRHFVGVFAFSALLNLLFLVPMLYMLQVYDRVVPTRGGTTLLLLTGILLYGLGTLALLDLVRSRLMVRASLRLERSLGGAVFDAALSAKGATMERLAGQQMREFDLLRQALTGPAMIAVADLPWAPIYILVAFLIHPILGAMILAGTLAMAGIAVLNHRRSSGPLGRAHVAAARAYAAQDEVVASADAVRALGMRGAMAARAATQRSAMLEAQTQASFASSGHTVVSRFLRLALQSLALGLGAWLAISGRISMGAIFVASYLGSRALQPIDQMLASWPTIVSARGAYQALERLLARKPKAEATQLPDPTGQIEVEQLTVIAGETSILKGISFGARPGDVVAVIGPSGAGKSTLLAALAGAVHPSAGIVRIDGADAEQWDREKLAQFIGYLPQDVSLFSGTIAQNIARFAGGGDKAAIDSEVVEAATACGAHEVIVRLDKGYDRPLGHGGSGLSAGQAQRVALARALFRKPVLVLLDEPNAHVDSDGEVALSKALLELKKRGATVLIVSHRKDVLVAVDKILVLKGGAIELYGPRDEVLAKLAGLNAKAAALAEPVVIKGKRA